MKRKILILIIINIIILSGCGLLSANNNPEQIQTIAVPTQIPTEAPSIPIQGVWVTPDRSSMVIITNEYFYLNVLGSGREVYARIDRFNLEEETVDVFTTAIIIGGQYVGYDSPNRNLKYHLNGNVLDLTGFHLELDTVTYILDEFLNGQK